MSVSSSLPTSVATASKTSVDGASPATSVATRRNAACSSASRARDSRDSALAIAVATSSVKLSRRSSVSGGSASLEFRVIAPQTRPSTTTGLPTWQRKRRRRRTSGCEPLAPSRKNPWAPSATQSVEFVRPRRTDEDTFGAGIEPDDRRYERGLHAREHMRDLLGDRREELRRWDTLRNERRDPPESCLLVGQAL